MSELTIQLPYDECAECPELSLTTDTLYANGTLYMHTHTCINHKLCEGIRHVLNRATKEEDK